MAEQEWKWEVSEAQREAAAELLGEFKNRVHKLFFAFGELGHGRELLRTQYEQTFDHSNSDSQFTFAYQVNDDPNNIQLRTIAAMKQGELIGALQREGEFENLNCLALIVFMYHLWDEYYRPRIATALGLQQTRQLKSNFFGDIRVIRTAIIHHQAVLAEQNYGKITVLARFEELRPGELKLTLNTIQVLVAGLDSLQLHATPPQRRGD